MITNKLLIVSVLLFGTNAIVLDDEDIIDYDDFVDRHDGTEHVDGVTAACKYKVWYLEPCSETEHVQVVHLVLARGGTNCEIVKRLTKACVPTDLNDHVVTPEDVAGVLDGLIAEKDHTRDALEDKISKMSDSELPEVLGSSADAETRNRAEDAIMGELRDYDRARQGISADDFTATENEIFNNGNIFKDEDKISEENKEMSNSDHHNGSNEQSQESNKEEEHNEKESQEGYGYDKKKSHEETQYEEKEDSDEDKKQRKKESKDDVEYTVYVGKTDANSDEKQSKYDNYDNKDKYENKEKYEKGDKYKEKDSKYDKREDNYDKESKYDKKEKNYEDKMYKKKYRAKDSKYGNKYEDKRNKLSNKDEMDELSVSIDAEELEKLLEEARDNKESVEESFIIDKHETDADLKSEKEWGSRLDELQERLRAKQEALSHVAHDAVDNVGIRVKERLSDENNKDKTINWMVTNMPEGKQTVLIL